MANHVQTISHGDISTYYYRDCSCGWQGPPRHTIDEAAGDSCSEGKVKHPITLKNGRVCTHTWNANHWDVNMSDGGEMDDNEWREYADAVALQNAHVILRSAGLK